MDDGDGGKKVRLEIAPATTGPARIVTAPSYLIDRFVPDCEVICLPAKAYGGGTASFELGPFTAPALPAPRLRDRLRGRTDRGPAPAPLGPDRVMVDFRVHAPSNWAHFLNNHVPILCAIAETFAIAPGTVTVLLPARIPRYIRDAAALLGLEVLCTDAAVAGHGVRFDVTPWTGLRSMRHRWLGRAGWVRAALDAAEPGQGVGDLPRRVFLSRPRTRTLRNEAEVEAWLARRGYVKIYPETLPAIDQFRLFEAAESIVAIHGAGLAPLLYRSDRAALREIVELMPCGHMTDVYRIMAEQMGVRWIGVRGRIKPDYMRVAYQLDRPFTEFSLDPFEIDLVSLDRAMEMIGEEAGKGG